MNWKITLEDAEFHKDQLIDELQGSIQFVPRRGMDLYWFMQEYMREAEQDNRQEVLEKILGHLIDCAEGRDYPDPKEGGYTYIEDDVNQLRQALENAIEAAKCGDPDVLMTADLALRNVQMDFEEDPENGMLTPSVKDKISLVFNLCREASAIIAEQKENGQGSSDVGPSMNMEG